MTQAFKRSLMAATAGLLGYGGWAFFVNQSAGMGMGLRAAAIQGGYSFILTLGMTLITEKLYRSLPPRHSTWLTVVLTSGTIWWVAYGIHTLNNTPNIVATILPGFIIGAIYTTAYVTALNAGRRRTPVMQKNNVPPPDQPQPQK